MASSDEPTTTGDVIFPRMLRRVLWRVLRGFGETVECRVVTLRRTWTHASYEVQLFHRGALYDVRACDTARIAEAVADKTLRAFLRDGWVATSSSSSARTPGTGADCRS